jgi:hypothetical protein
MKKPAFSQKILVILLAVAILLFLASWFYNNQGATTRNEVRAANVIELRDAIYNFVYDNGAYPGCLKVQGVVKENDIQRCRDFSEELTKSGLYIKEIPMDVASDGWETGYSVAKGSDNQVTVSAVFAEGGEVITARTN